MGEPGVVIVGSSGYVFEVASILAALDRQVAGICGPADLATRLGVERLASEQDLDGLPPNCPVALAVGHPAARADLDRELREAGRRVATLVHPSATLGLMVEIGDGTIIAPGAKVTANVTLGRHVLIHTAAVISHDGQLGDHVTIGPSVTLAGGVRIAERSNVGAGATVLPGVTIGADAVIGAGAVVTRDVAPGLTVAGVPAQPR